MEEGKAENVSLCGRERITKFTVKWYLRGWKRSETVWNGVPGPLKKKRNSQTAKSGDHSYERSLIRGLYHPVLVSIQ